jgi:hypothetical protein
MPASARIDRAAISASRAASAASFAAEVPILHAPRSGRVIVAADLREVVTGVPPPAQARR